MQKTLDEFVIGEAGIIANIGGDGKIRRRLFDMGITPGARVTLRKRAPLGDPIEVTIRGYELTLRKSEAIAVFMKDCVLPTTKSVDEAKAELQIAKEKLQSAKKALKGNKNDALFVKYQDAKQLYKDAKETYKTAVKLQKIKEKQQRKQTKSKEEKL